MNGEKFVLASTGIWGGLVAVGSAVYLLLYGAPPPPELADAAAQAGDAFSRTVAESLGLIGGLVALYGRYRATQPVSIVPK